jgi:hypothetical protein
MVAGSYSAIVYAQTGVDWLADWFSNDAANPGLRYMQSQAYGYGLVRLSAGEATGTLVTIPTPTVDTGEEPPLALPPVSYTVKSWGPEQNPDLIAV